MEKINVLLLLTDWTLMGTFFHAMQNDSSFNVKIICPSKSDYYDEIKKYCSNMEYCRDENNKIIDLKIFSPDIIFIDHHYDSQFPKTYRIEQLTRIAKVCYIPYCVILANGTTITYNKSIYKFWKIFVSAEKAKEVLINKDNFRPSQIEVCGLPRSDLYSDYTDSSKWKLKKNRNVKRILWAPHWSVHWGWYKKHDEAGFSQFLNYKDYMVSLADRFPNFDIILRPHPNLFKMLVSWGIYTQKELEEFKNLINEKKNMSIHEDWSFVDILVSSDIMITDSISFLGEYLPTMKPLLHLYNPDGPGYNLYGQEIIKAHYRALNIEDAEEFIQTVVIQNNDYKKSIRKEIFNSQIFMPEEGVGVYIKNYIKKEFEKEYYSSPLRRIESLIETNINEIDVKAIASLLRTCSNTPCQIIDINASCKELLDDKAFNNYSYIGLINSPAECKIYNSKYYNHPYKLFIVTDLLREIIPKGDIIFAFGIFNGMDKNLGNEIIQKFINSQSHYFLINGYSEPEFLEYIPMRVIASSITGINYYLYNMKDAIMFPINSSHEFLFDIRKFISILNYDLSILENILNPNEYLSLLESFFIGQQKVKDFARSIPALLQKWEIFQDLFCLYYNYDWVNSNTHYNFLHEGSYGWANEITMNTINNLYNLLYFEKK